MTVKTDWALRFYSEVLGLEYLHYGLWDGEPVTVAGLREAQQRYADTLIAMIPQGAKRVLDVGCGTGAVAARLRAGGFEVEALSPDPYHQQVVRERHGDLTFHLSRFEDYSGAGDFDVVLMSESSQYIALDILFEAARRAAPNGHLLVADYFNFSRDGGVVTRSGHLLDEFLAAAEGAGYAIDERRDITDAAAPTLDLGTKPRGQPPAAGSEPRPRPDPRSLPLDLPPGTALGRGEAREARDEPASTGYGRVSKVEALRDDSLPPRGAGAVMHTLGSLAEGVGGSVQGDPARAIRGITSLEQAQPEDLSFFTHPAYRQAAIDSSAGALVVARADDRLTSDLLICDDPALAVARLLEIFHPSSPHQAGFHPTAAIDATAEVDPTASVGAFAVIGAETLVGPGARIHPHVTVGSRCHIGAEAVLHPQVVLYNDTVVGERTIIHAGTIIGADGFGYVAADGGLLKVPQVGAVHIEADVEIGANSAIDRATVAHTRIGRGTKIDNLVQIGHNVEIGRSCILCGQVGIAGSARVGDGVVMAGQAGAVGHIHVGSGVKVAAQSAVFKSVEPGESVAGTPARSIGTWRRQVALTGRLQSFRERLARLERAVEGKGDSDDDTE